MSVSKTLLIWEVSGRHSKHHRASARHMETWVQCMVPLKEIEYGVYGDLIITWPYSIYLRGTLVLKNKSFRYPCVVSRDLDCDITSGSVGVALLATRLIILW